MAHQDRRQHLPAQSGRLHGARRFRHQDAEGSRGQDRRHDGGQRAIPAMAGLRQGRRHRRIAKFRSSTSIRPASAPALVSNKVDAIGGFAQGYVPAIEIRGKKEVRIFWFADYGVTVVSNGIIVHEDLIKSDPELVRAFVAPTIKGFLYGRQHPDEAVAVGEEVSADRRSGDHQARVRAVVEDLGDAQHQGQAARLGFRRRLGRAPSTVLKQYGGVTAPLDQQVRSIPTNSCRPAPNTCRRRRVERRDPTRDKTAQRSRRGMRLAVLPHRTVMTAPAGCLYLSRMPRTTIPRRPIMTVMFFSACRYPAAAF